MVTAGTLNRTHIFREEAKLAFLESSLLSLAEEFGWTLEAWAIFSSHYHFVGRSPEGGSNLRAFTNKLHGTTARWVNRQDDQAGRRVWFSYHQTALTFEKSYLARLHYVIQNPVKHGLVAVADQYPYCSAEWFRLRAEPAWYDVVTSFPTDRMNVEDDY
ncbi:hypothetical protein EON79_22665 [bacterium]|nr:MAG: hypothetical protein EON79_22665 [bacterium]